jgi:hypothetical protein
MRARRSRPASHPAGCVHRFLFRPDARWRPDVLEHGTPELASTSRMSLNTGASPLGSEIVSSTVNGKPSGGISHPCGSSSSQTFASLRTPCRWCGEHLDRAPFESVLDGLGWRAHPRARGKPEVGARPTDSQGDRSTGYFVAMLRSPPGPSIDCRASPARKTGSSLRGPAAATSRSAASAAAGSASPQRWLWPLVQRWRRLRCAIYDARRQPGWRRWGSRRTWSTGS